MNTLKEIAEEAGVSISTVSRTLNTGRELAGMSEKQRIIYNIAKKNGYFKNKENLLPSETYRLGCIFMSEHENITYPFFSEIYKGIQEEIQKGGRNVQLNLTSENIIQGKLDTLEPYDGAIILGRASKAVIEELRLRIPRLVYAGLSPIPGLDNVVSDIRDGIKTIVGYLASCGYGKIGYIGPTPAREATFNEYRYQAYCEALEANGLSVDPSLVEDSFLLASFGYDAAKKLLDRAEPDAIVCGNDNTAIGVMKARAERGKHFAVTGCDNIPDAAYLTPSLTTLDIPKKDLGHYAALTLLDSFSHVRDYPLTISVPSHLIIRESTKKAEI